MSHENSGTKSVTVLVKALPQPSEKYAETVCVAGVTRDGEWRRLYPIRFRQLEDKFRRWHWIEYKWHRAHGDKRSESRNVDNETLRTLHPLRPAERARFLTPLIRTSTDEAVERKESLTIIRPTNVNFSWEEKTTEEIAAERRGFSNAARQTSFFDSELKVLNPCPYKFFFEYTSADGKGHRNFCHDWETSAAFHNLSRSHSATDALKHLSNEYNHRYPQAGMAFAMGTHSQRPTQWLLIGVLRLDEEKQASLDL